MQTTHNLRSIARALAGQVAGRDSVLVPGPGHSRRDRSLKVKFRADGTFNVTSFANDDWRTCKDYIRERLGLPNDCRREHANDDRPIIHLRGRDDDEPARIRSALKRWETAAPIMGTLAEKYLASRGLTYSGDAIRFRVNDRSMVALITDAVTGEPCGVHCTYLDRNGRKTGRKMHGRAKGAVEERHDDNARHLAIRGSGVFPELCQRNTVPSEGEDYRRFRAAFWAAAMGVANDNARIDIDRRGIGSRHTFDEAWAKRQPAPRVSDSALHDRYCEGRRVHGVSHPQQSACDARWC